MTIQYGFFNSVDGDRVYTADDMCKPYDMLVSDGVFPSPTGGTNTNLQVYAAGNMTVGVREGRGIFGSRWFISDSDITLNVETANAYLERIDSVIVRVDTSEDVRAITVLVKSGTPATTPLPPALERSNNITEYRLANITVPVGATYLNGYNITDTRNSEDCGWVSSRINDLSLTGLKLNCQQDFDEWFATIEEQVSHANIMSTSTTYTTVSSTRTAMLPTRFNYAGGTDILQVYVNGLYNMENRDYTLSQQDSLWYINFTSVASAKAGDPVYIVCHKTIDGCLNEAEVTEIYNMKNNYLSKTTGGTILGNLAVKGTLDVDSEITLAGSKQAVYANGTTNMQFGTSNLDTRINGANDIYLGTRCKTLSMVPNVNNAYQIGNADYRYKSIYLTAAPNVSSDARLKNVLSDVDGGEMLDFIRRLNVVNYEFKDNPDVERIGLIAQEVEEAGGEKFVEVSESGMYGLKQSNLVYPIISAVQALYTRVLELEAQLEASNTQE